MLATAGGLTIPSLDDVPTSYTWSDQVDVAAQIAARMIEADVADPEDWEYALGNPVAFIEQQIKGWIMEAEAGGVEEHFGVGALLASHVNQLFDWEGEATSLERMYLAFVPLHWCAVIEMRHVVDLLESVHPRLPRTFEHWYVGSLRSVAEVWGVEETRDWMDVFGDWILEQCGEALAAGEEMPWPIQMTDEWEFVALIDHPSLMRTPLAERTVRRRLASMPERVRKIMELTLELKKAAAKAPMRYPEHFFDQELETEWQEPLPILVLSNERYDAIERAWDSEYESRSALGEPVAPYMVLPFRPLDVDDLQRVRQDFIAAARVFGLAARIYGLLPKQDPRTLVEVLREEDQ